jgi:1-deoxy-D-xylulose-5-phosphate synthase
VSERGTRLIDALELPEGLRHLDEEGLRQVAVEVREAIIETVSRNGGHLGSSLGVVELTIALHAELDTPKDMIIWDVGHQAYAHKLLTGRVAAFDSIRTYGGLSGFPSREESVFDVFGTGHASTSISAAMGMLEAAGRGERDGSNHARQGADSKGGSTGRLVAVIGDGALTGGMAYEALNHAGHLRTPVLVVLNDNAMSIEKNVGAMSAYLSRLRTDPTLYRFRRDLERRVQ